MYLLIGILFLIVCCLAVYGYYLFKQLDEEIEEIYDQLYSKYTLVSKEEKKKVGKVIEL